MDHFCMAMDQQFHSIIVWLRIVSMNVPQFGGPIPRPADYIAQLCKPSSCSNRAQRSRPRLAIALCLSGRYEEALFVIAVVCSTWSAVNLATSERSILTPYGNQSLPSVRAGNRMVARPIGPFRASLIKNIARTITLYHFVSSHYLLIFLLVWLPKNPHKFQSQYCSKQSLGVLVGAQFLRGQTRRKFSAIIGLGLLLGHVRNGSTIVGSPSLLMS